jgi:hypothetical protein
MPVGDDAPCCRFFLGPSWAPQRQYEDRDTVRTVLANGCYRGLGRRPRGLEKAAPQQLERRFVATSGTAVTEAKRIVVQLDRRSQNPSLREAALDRDQTAIPWWHGRPVAFSYLSRCPRVRSKGPAEIGAQYTVRSPVYPRRELRVTAATRPATEALSELLTEGQAMSQPTPRRALALCAALVTAALTSAGEPTPTKSVPDPHELLKAYERAARAGAPPGRVYKAQVTPH